MTVSESVLESTIEVFTEVSADLTLQLVFEKGKHKTKLSKNMNLFTVYFDRPLDPGSLKINGVIVPAVFDVKFVGQVLCQLVSRFLRFFTVHFVRGIDVDSGHDFSSQFDGERSLDRLAFGSQLSVGWVIR
jgi:hypothetical protein